MSEYSFDDFKVGRRFSLGYITLTEEEIIEFAQRVDPLDFHINKKIAAKSHFKGLVASGAHVFTKFHIQSFLPLFKDSILAGLQVNYWKFLKPVYPGTEIFGTVAIKSIKANAEKQHAVVVWDYRFFDKKGENVQTVESVLLHKMV